MEELASLVNEIATEYWNNTGVVKIEKMPTSIVNFVIEIFMEYAHFPFDFPEEEKINKLMNRKVTLAMACADVLARAGHEGETEHRESNVNITYKSAWISNELFADFPRYARF